jgi:hypothetical protein
MPIPDKTSIVPGSEDGSSNAPDNAPAPGGTDFRKQFEAERTARLQRDKQYDELRSLHGRQSAELGELRRRAQPDPYGADDYEPEQPQPRRTNGQYKKQRDEGEAFTAALDGFQLDLMRQAKNLPNGAWEPYYDKAVEFVRDPVNAEVVAGYDANGNFDYRKILRAALREVQLKELYEAREKSAAKRNELDTANDATRMRAMVSGGGASDDGRETVDLANMPQEEFQKLLIAQGAIDPSNPPSFAKSGFQFPKK